MKMPSIASALSLASLVGAVLAVPLGPSDPSRLFARQNSCPAGAPYFPNDWCSTNPADRIMIQVTDDKIEWGELNPGDLIGAVRASCSGGICSHDLSQETIVIRQNSAAKATVKITTLDVATDSIHLGPMLDAIQKTLDNGNVLEVKEVTYVSPVVCPVGPCNPQDKTSTQIVGPRGISIILKEASDAPIFDRGTVSSLKVEFNIEVADPTSLSGACSALGGAAGAVVGVANPALGAVGAVALLGCLAVP